MRRLSALAVLKASIPGEEALSRIPTLWERPGAASRCYALRIKGFDAESRISPGSVDFFDSVPRVRVKGTAGWCPVQPDIVFLMNDNLPDVEEAKNFQGIPDLVVEVLSPGTRQMDLDVKLKAYEQAGVPEYWIVDPKGLAQQGDSRP